MCFNIGKLDRAIRIILGLALIGFGLIAEYYMVAFIGAIPFLTGALAFCPFYTIFKFDTGCKSNS